MELPTGSVERARGSGDAGATEPTSKEIRVSLWVIPIATALLGAMAGAFGANVSRREAPEAIAPHGQAAGGSLFLPFNKKHTGHLVAGWSAPERLANGDSFCWCAAKTCVVSFSSQGPAAADRWIAFEADAFTYPGSPRQAVEISLNGTSLGLLAFPGPVLRVRAPSSAWRSGRNLLEFSFAYAEAPKDHSPKNQDPRRLSASFRWISVVDS